VGVKITDLTGDPQGLKTGSSVDLGGTAEQGVEKPAMETKCNRRG
jgi:hypothetical protein